ncbi:MAG: MFS transporter [Lachnospiraceae bacterium]|nr:MFS transporter [Lachnospiraceae bacterium]
MKNIPSSPYMKGFLPYAFAAFLVGIVGGLSTVLGPAFVQDMNLSYNNTTWTALSQAISTAACAPILGKLGDIFGRRKTLLSGVGVFLLGNILSALAPSLIFMLFSRFIVGIGIAAIAPTVMSYIVTEFPPQKIAKGFSLYMLISSSAVIFGPSLGGIILQLTNWRILMWISSILCALFLILCFLTHPKDNYALQKVSGFDKCGAILVIIFFSFLLCVPSFGQNFGWFSPAFIAVLVLALLSLAGLLIAERKASNPILSGKFIGRKSFLLSVIILFLTQGLMQANMTNTIVFVNYTQSDNAVISGYAISIMYFGMSLGSILLGSLADRYEPKRILTGSLFLTGVGCGLMLLFSTSTTILILASSLGILGFGLGANATIFMKIVLSDLPAETAGSGTGIYGLFRDLAAPFGVAVFVPMFTNEITRLASISGPDTSIAFAAVSAVHMLALIEVSCVAIGILVVQLLPNIRKK